MSTGPGEDGGPPSVATVYRAASQIESGFTGPDDSVFADDFTFHYFNAQLPELEGDYEGLDGVRGFFERLQTHSGGTFSVQGHSLTPFGDELVAAYATISLTIDEARLELDALLVWRAFGDQVHEAWDIPAVNTVRLPGMPSPGADER